MPAIPGSIEPAAPVFMTPREVAVILRLGVRTVRAMIRAGSLPGAYRVGRVWRVRRDQLEETYGALDPGADADDDGLGWCPTCRSTFYPIRRGDEIVCRRCGGAPA